MSHPVINKQPLGRLWPTLDPFLFCAHHLDAYPASNGELGVQAVELEHRETGSDFSGKDGFNMYHGEVVPGFPGHPHRGFETVTLVRQGLIDHADSLGAAARFGHGDVQWLTAGKGIMHSEMFPLVNRDSPNPLELFQIWLNLPAASKMVEPHFTMFWNERIPRFSQAGADGRRAEVAVIAGALPGANRPLPPPPESWAADPAHDVAIWTLTLEPGARWTMPAASNAGARRMFYWFVGDGLRLDAQALDGHAAYELAVLQPVEVVNTGSDVAECLVLQGLPVGERVAQYGPFVMNTEQEIMQAMQDFRRTRFGGWPWKENDPVHGEQPRRFARHPGAAEEETPPLD
ncbi:pirin family protein [Diaphorobacter ruginosibacter]|uniref:pirin family protein n=1 Tax=Diaphorobacter ruginosibacter TaxID=1715720 RepID=UPI00333F45CD